MSMTDEKFIVKLRGLPWNSTAKDIIDFLKECQTLEGEKSVHMAISHRDGRPNGEAFVELTSQGDVDKAFEYNKNVLGHRYIEIFNAKPEEFEMCLKRQNLVQQDTFIKLRGLPFSCKTEDIEQFFEGLEIRNGGNGIYIVYDNRGRPTGEAFVQFSNSEDTDLAMKKNREKIGQRYIEIFRSSSSECRRSTIFNNGGGNGPRNGGLGGFNNDRGMGRGPRNNRSNFRDRPYPDTPWSGGNNNSNNDAPWRNNNRGNFGGGNSGGFGNDNFGNGGNNFNNDSNGNSNNFSSDFERNWNSGGNNSFNSFSGGSNLGKSGNLGGGGGSGGGAFNRDSFGFGGGNNNNSFGGGNNNSFGGNNDRFMGNNMNNGGGQYAVHLRGMPYDCAEDDVQQFFAPLKLVNVEILYNNNGRHTGEADAYFGNVADAQEAMKKHKEKMGSRYIELFAKSNDQRRGGGGGGNGRF